jgi:branched-chain amino acid transport system permease protein
MVSAYLCAIGLALLAYFGIHSFPLLIFGTLVCINVGIPC